MTRHGFHGIPSIALLLATSLPLSACSDGAGLPRTVTQHGDRGSEASSEAFQLDPARTNKSLVKRTLVAIDIDAAPAAAATDGFVTASTWTGACPGAPILFDQALTGYSDRRHQIWDSAYGANRALSIGFPVQAGHVADLARKCNGPDTYPVASFFSFGTATAGSPELQQMYRVYQASEDGFVIGSAWTPGNAGHEAIAGFVGAEPKFDETGYRDVVAFDADWGAYRTASIVFPVKKGDFYKVKPHNVAPGTFPHMTFMPVPGLGVGSYEAISLGQEMTASSDGFVVASGWTGACLRDGYPFQQIDGYLTDEAGAYQRMAVKASWGEWRAVSITFPVLKGRKYKIGAFCQDGHTHAQAKFVPLDSPDGALADE
jgi:hypothetical protein